MNRIILIFVATAFAVTSLLAQNKDKDRTALIVRLDSIVREAYEKEPLAGVSVAVMRGDDVLLKRSYGHADLSLKVPATDETTYRMDGITLYAAIMQLVEKGKIRLDDDASKLLPEFPWQGKRVTVRQLMDATSGLPDYHYLGDPYAVQIATLKAPDEVTALFAGRPFNHEPGERWQWTISGHHLAGILLERVTGQSYRQYVEENVFRRSGLKRTYFCDDRAVVPGLARSYNQDGKGFRNNFPQSATTWPYIITTCTTATDAVSLMRALRDGRLLRPESYRTMTTAEGAARTAWDGSFSIGFRMGKVGEHRVVRKQGSLMGFSTAVFDFPESSLTIAVFSNTGGQAASRIANPLAHAVLGVPLPPVTSQPAVEPPVEKAPLTAAERERYIGAYRTKWAGAPAHQWQPWQLTFRVFEHNGRLVIQSPNEAPDTLLHQGENVFKSGNAVFTFTLLNGRATALKMQSGSMSLGGPRADDAWPVRPLSNQ